MNQNITPKMAFQSVMNEFAKAQMPEIQRQVEAGTYELPMDGYILRLIFPGDNEKPGILYTLLGKSCMVSTGVIDLTQIPPVLVTDYPGEMEIPQIIDIIAQRIPKETDLTPVPILLNGKEISDEWVEWYRKSKPGTSYADAVIEALILVRHELKRMESVLDKYKLPS